MYVYKSQFFNWDVDRTCILEGIHYPDDSEKLKKKGGGASSVKLTSPDNSVKQLISMCENGVHRKSIENPWLVTS